MFFKPELQWQRLHCMPWRIKSAQHLKAWGHWRTTGMVCKVFVPNVSEEGRFIWRCCIHGAVRVSLSSLCINMSRPNTKRHVGPCGAQSQPISRAVCLPLSRASDDQHCHCVPDAEGDKMSSCDIPAWATHPQPYSALIWAVWASQWSMFMFSTSD